MTRKAGAQPGNRHAAGTHQRSAQSAALTSIIVQLRDVHKLSWRGIVIRLRYDFGINLSHAAVWQRYRRGKR